MEIKAGQKAILKTWAYAVPVSPSRAERVRGRAFLLHKETPVVIWRVESGTAIVGATHSGRTVLAPVNVRDVEFHPPL